MYYQKGFTRRYGNYLHQSPKLRKTKIKILLIHILSILGTDLLSRYSDSLGAGLSGDRIPLWGEILCTRLDWPWGPSSLLYNGYRDLFSGRKAAGGGAVDHPPPSSAKVEERVQLYIYSPSGPSWPVMGRAF
jgi:hypothetical protein